MKKIAVVAASGIGDALIMKAVSHHLESLQYETTTFSNALSSLGCWLPTGKLFPQPPIALIEKLFSPFDAVFLQHDNSEKARLIQKLPIPVYSFYGAHLPAKHGSFSKTQDYACDRTQSMLVNAGRAAVQFFGGTFTGKIGLTPPIGLKPKRYPKRIAIHPTSTSLAKNWSRDKFLAVFDQLMQEGLEPVFTVSPQERQDWPNAPSFYSLETLATFLYESGGFLGNDSGLGHLASALNLPHLILGPSKPQLTLWGPGWYQGKKLFPPSWLLLWRRSHDHWQKFISVKKVIKELRHEVL